jgi:hypothetical protein
MRRMLTAAVAMTALALPGVALAHGGDRQRAEDHHGVHHGERHRHARLIAFHAHAPATTTPSVGAGASPSPAPVASERAGTIASFTGGTLTITLNDGTTVSGKVTPRTEIECHSASATAADNGDRGRDDGGGNDAGDDDAHDEAEHCMPIALVPGASVREALLSVSSVGAFWVKLEL